ncbi:hypothetical protein [Thiothrix fructosivorans]|uniref:hypothetical protein n=1 Tax=Thiothrix fructosivorans TaxID=111770 RepID=UPI003559017E
MMMQGGGTHIDLLGEGINTQRLGKVAFLNSAPLVLGRKSVAGSLIGGIAETQEMLDFCGEHGITSDIEVIQIQEINAAYERMLKSDVKYRFVIDMASLKA